MRRVLFLALAAAIAALALAAATAGAQTVTKFSVVEKVKTAKRTDTGIVTTGVLLSPTTGGVVGTDKVKFTQTGHVGGVLYFADGKLKVAGNLNHRKVPIVGGTRRWDGASGKLKFEPLSSRKTLLTFTVVQG
jgi:hypothetical protein